MAESVSRRSNSAVALGPPMPPCADCGQTGEPIYFHDVDREWVCEEPSFCIENRLHTALDLLQRAEPYVRAARHSSGVTCATALADEIVEALA